MKGQEVKTYIAVIKYGNKFLNVFEFWLLGTILDIGNPLISVEADYSALMVLRLTSGCNDGCWWGWLAVGKIKYCPLSSLKADNYIFQTVYNQ